MPSVNSAQQIVTQSMLLTEGYLFIAMNDLRDGDIDYFPEPGKKKSLKSIVFSSRFAYNIEKSCRKAWRFLSRYSVL